MRIDKYIGRENYEMCLQSTKKIGFFRKSWATASVIIVAIIGKAIILKMLHHTRYTF